MIANTVRTLKKEFATPNIILAIFILLFASVCQWINHHYTQYMGNQYVPLFAKSILLFIVLIYAGTTLLSSQTSYWAKMLKRLGIVYSSLWLLVYLTDSVQYTPFPPIDSWLILLDAKLHFQTQKALNWLSHYPAFSQLLTYAYAFLQLELLLFILALVFIENNKKLNESLFLLFSTAIIGFGFYYFFPTIAPAGMIPSPHFFKEQFDTSLKFRQIHQHLTPTTIEGGLIAMPSFHCIWALVCQRYCNSWPLLWWLLLPINLLLISACVLLGWHYFVDILGGIVVFYLCLKIMQYLQHEQCA